MFSAVTHGIRVIVEPSFLAQESDPDEQRFVWSYRVQIENHGPVGFQLLSRRWLITDANGVRREVNGRGVVGQQPIVPPGGVFEYTSGCPLNTSSGIMVGSYRVMTEGGAMIDVEIPAFSLDSPHTARVLN